LVSAVEHDGAFLAKDFVVVKEVRVSKLGLAVRADKVLWVESLVLGSHTFANNRAIAFRANEAQPTVVVPFAVGKSLMFKEAASEWIVARLADKALGMVLPANCIRAFTLDGESALGALGCEPIDPIGLAIGLTIRALHHGNVVFIKVAPTDGACQVILAPVHVERFEHLVRHRLTARTAWRSRSGTEAQSGHAQ